MNQFRSVCTKCVAYVRVSTVEQGESGLGLEAQTQAIRDFIANRSLQLLDIYSEIESGTNCDRPQLQRALAHCKTTGAYLICKLDRLARNVAFFSALLDSGVKFIFYDNPDADKFTLQILACVAEQEARMISQRTKSALQALKNRGVKLGSPLGFAPGVREKGQVAAREAIKKKQLDWLKNTGPLIATAYENQEGHLVGTARNLQKRGICNRVGRDTWTACAVRKVFEQLQEHGLLSAAIAETDHKNDPDFFLSHDRRKFFRPVADDDDTEEVQVEAEAMVQ